MKNISPKFDEMYQDEESRREEYKTSRSMPLLIGVVIAALAAIIVLMAIVVFVSPSSFFKLKERKKAKLTTLTLTSFTQVIWIVFKYSNILKAFHLYFEGCEVEEKVQRNGVSG